jgi:adenine C2-methylase RlmN of 23S rRNA A2503 and tRNA A37
MTIVQERTMLRTLKLVEEKELFEGGTGRGYILETSDGFPVFTTDKKLNDTVEGKNKWKIGVSLSSGCPLRCVYCFTNKFDFYSPLNSEEIIDQVDYVVNQPDNNPQDYDETRVEMKQMGDPLANGGHTLEAILKLYETYPDFLYVVSTSGLDGNSRFFNGLKKQRDLGTKVRLQFSCHTTNDKERQILSPGKKIMTLEEMSKVVDFWYEGQEKVTLNFIPFEGYELSSKKLAETFDPSKVFVKLSYIDENRFTKKKGLTNRPQESTKKFVDEITAKGFTTAYRNRPQSK